MVKFRPFLGMHLTVESMYLEFVPHPLFPEDSEAVFVLEGGEALIYQMRDVKTKDLYALKVIKPAYRSQNIALVAETIARLAHVSGFYIHNRVCLTMAGYADLIKTYPDLEYATFMPWLTGKTWSGLMQDQSASAQYTREQACGLAATVANLLRNLESLHLAHSDIAGGNLFLSPDLRRIQLLDLEGLYLPDVRPPPFCSQGSPGYQHHHLGPRGQWYPEGDRFAGAILLTEILTWWNPRVRAYIADDANTLFQSAELQTTGLPLWLEVRNTLWSIQPDLLHLFDQAWSSSSLAECPEITSWSALLFSFLP